MNILETHDGDSELAPAATLLGQLQRGRGSGFLWALRENPASVHALLVECITGDPRWDSQVETRSEYYARLAALTQMRLAPLDEYLRVSADDPAEPPTWLTIETLGELARLGNADAVTILRDYLSYGRYWDVALEELATLPGPEATAGLADVLCARFEPGQQMQESAVYDLASLHSLDPLWQSWRQTHPCMARLLNEASMLPRKRDRPVSPNYEAFSLDELLATANADNRRPISKFLVSRLYASDVDLYAATFSTDNPFAWWIAFQCLTALDQAPAFYDAILTRLVTYLESDPPPTRWPARRHAVNLILVQLPPEMTLPLARRWFDSPQWYLRRAGEDILEEHATEDDISRTRTALAAALDSATQNNADYYRVSTTLEILTRFPEIGLLPEVEAAFVRSGYSYDRMRAAQAMQANAPVVFAATYAYECLWDCEDTTRQIGCEAVSLALAGAAERLRALADDPVETDTVKAAAGARLATRAAHGLIV